MTGLCIRILKMHHLITEDVFRRLYPLQDEINDHTFTPKGQIWQQTVSFHYLTWHLMFPFTYCSPDTYRLSIKTALGLSLKSIHKYFSRKFLFCDMESSSGLNHFCLHRWMLPENYFFFYLALISRRLVIRQWFISWLFHSFRFSDTLLPGSRVGDLSFTSCEQGRRSRPPPRVRYFPLSLLCL